MWKLCKVGGQIKAGKKAKINNCSKKINFYNFFIFRGEIIKRHMLFCCYLLKKEKVKGFLFIKKGGRDYVNFVVFNN